MQNSHPLHAMQKCFFCLDSLIAHMYSKRRKAIGCVTGVIEL